MPDTKAASPRKQQPAKRDGARESPWQSLPAAPGSQAKFNDIVYDAAVVGGGITGMTTALLIQREGKQCILIDAHNPGFGTTGGTSAHINTFADTTYKETESAFGKQGAQLFADAINEGFGIIRDNIARYEISCDFEVKEGFLYAEDEKQADELNDIYLGCIQNGIKAAYTEQVPTALAYNKALIFEGQAQFHPLKYLKALEAAFIKAGGSILEQTRISAVDSETATMHFLTAGDKTVRARNVIYATHIPPGLNIFSLRCAPYRSYVLGVTLRDKAYPDALVYDMQEPYHYFRAHTVNGKKYLIAGGNDHKTGHEEPEKAFDKLEKYIRKHYNVGAVRYKWSSQYYVPIDGLPYIGQMPGQNRGIYCATGYNGNGMMLGSVAAGILRDLLTGKKNKYEELFAPSRMKPIAGLKEFVSENADVAYQFVSGRLPAHEVDSLKRLKKDSGKIVAYEGNKLAVYRDVRGKIHALNPVCKHAKCIVQWNDTEKSWDCPCHGARYNIEGEVLNGPADRNLEKILFEGNQEKA